MKGCCVYRIKKSFQKNYNNLYYKKVVRKQFWTPIVSFASFGHQTPALRNVLILIPLCKMLTDTLGPRHKRLLLGGHSVTTWLIWLQCIGANESYEARSMLAHPAQEGPAAFPVYKRSSANRERKKQTSYRWVGDSISIESKYFIWLYYD